METLLSYRLEDLILFSADTLTRLDELYLASVWPLHFVAIALAALTLWIMLAPSSLLLRRLSLIGTAGGFALMAKLYFLVQLSGIAPWGTPFAILFSLQALLMLIVVARLPNITAGPGLQSKLLGGAFAVLTLVLPAWGLLQGDPLKHLHLYGLAPAETALGFLVLACSGQLAITRKMAMGLTLIPTLWHAAYGLMLTGLGDPAGPIIAATGPLIWLSLLFMKSSPSPQ